jgi:hypothetical protein
MVVMMWVNISGASKKLRSRDKVPPCDVVHCINVEASRHHCQDGAQYCV